MSRSDIQVKFTKYNVEDRGYYNFILYLTHLENLTFEEIKSLEGILNKTENFQGLIEDDGRE